MHETNKAAEEQASDENYGPKEGVSFRLGLFLVEAALFFDAIQWVSELTNLIPIAGTVVAFVLGGFVNITAFIVMGAALYLSGFSVFNLKRGGSLIATSLVELIPLVKVLPAWTLWATVFILTNQVEALVNKSPAAPAAKTFNAAAKSPSSRTLPPSSPTRK